MNVTLKDFIITEKMKLAHSLLHNTSLSVSAVANKVGYTNFSYFSQTYKRIWDVTPSKGRGASEE
jgi:two-component system response regulator YesN